MFGADNVVVELCDHGDPLDSARNDALATLAVRAGLPLVATNNVHYATPARRRLATALAAVRARRSLDDLAGWLPAAGGAHLRSGDEQARRFARWPGAVELAAELGRACAFDLALVAPQLPPFPCPDGLDEMAYLRRLVEEGGARRYGPRGGAAPDGDRDRNRKAWAQIDHELAVIEALGFPGYFLVVWDIVEFCRRSDIYCQGRGSAANSAVCYALGVTNADAVALGLLFERFLSPERDGPPDIDIDIESGRREEAIQHVYRRHGRRHAAQVANVISYRARSAVRDMAKALGYSPGQQDAWSKQMDMWSTVASTAAELGQGPNGHDIPEPVLALAREVERAPRHLGIHSGGMVICDRPIVEVCPVEWGRFEGSAAVRDGLARTDGTPVDDEGTGADRPRPRPTPDATVPLRTVLQWDKDDCAAVGLVKFDLLGLGHARGAAPLRRLRAGRPRGRDRPRLPPTQDPEVYAMLCRADSVGVFQVESRAQMATLPRLRPETFYDLVVEVALIRPGPIQGGSVHPYIRRRKELEPVTYPHPLHGEGAREDPGRAPVPGAAHADRHRRRRVLARRGRRAAPGHGLEAQPRAHGAPAPAALRRHGRARRHRRGGRPGLGEAGRVRQLRLPREPLGELRLPGVRVVVAQAVLPGRVLRRPARRPAHGVLLAPLADPGRPPPRRRGPHPRPGPVGRGRHPRGRRPPSGPPRPREGPRQWVPSRGGRGNGFRIRDP